MPRDLEPANIKIRPDGTLKVLDFGLARAIDPAQYALVDTPQAERNGVVSPDGRSLAYEAETPTRPGQLDVFVRPFPDVQRSLWQISTGGGLYPAWGPKGRELFHLKPDGTLVAVPVEGTGGIWRAGARPRK